MKIVNITPGLIPIPPNGWGAVEKIIWEMHNSLLELGHDSQILYLDDIKEIGSINMLSASPYLIEMFDLSKQEARNYLSEWLKQKETI